MPYSFRSSRRLHNNANLGTFPLSVSANRRFFQSPSGVPFLPVGDAGWDVITQLQQSEMITYLNDRQAKGINTVIVELIENCFSQSPPFDANGNSPFTGATGGGGATTVADFSLPAATYWANVDFYLNACLARGFLVYAFPLYMGSHGGDQGWYNQLLANGTTKVNAYASFLAARYASFKNIIWVIGGDLAPDSTPTPLSGAALTLLEGFAAILKAANLTQLRTAHWGGPPDALATDVGDSSMHDVNFAQVGVITNDTVQRGYDLGSPVPVLLGEGRYEGNTGGGGATALQLRSQHWQSIFSGGLAGWIHGDEAVWPFGGNRTVSNPLFSANNGPWTSNLTTTSMSHFLVMATAIRSRAWHLLVPDESNTFVTAGRGTAGTANYVTASKASDGSWGGLYVPAAGSVTLAFSGFSAATVTIKRIDPTNGTPTTVTTHANSGSQAFDTTTFGNNAGGDPDWVVVVE